MTPAYLRDKVILDALTNHLRALRAEVEVNGFADRADELAAIREIITEYKMDKLREAEKV